MKIWDRQTEGKTEGRKDKARYRGDPQLKSAVWLRRKVPNKTQVEAFKAFKKQLIYWG